MWFSFFFLYLLIYIGCNNGIGVFFIIIRGGGRRRKGERKVWFSFFFFFFFFYKIFHGGRNFSIIDLYKEFEVCS